MKNWRSVVCGTRHPISMVEGRAWKPTDMASSMAGTKSIPVATFAVPPGCSPSPPPIGAVLRNLPMKWQCNCACVWVENAKSKRTLRVFFPHGVNFKQRRWPISAVGSDDFPCASQHLSISENKVAEHNMQIGDANPAKISRRVAIAALGLSLLSSSHNINMNAAIGAVLPPEDKPRLCDADCEKELENVSMVTTESGLQYKDITVGTGPSPPIGFQVAANYVAMVPSGQIFDSSLEKGQPYLFRVGSGQVIKGLDEGILSMKAGGKRRLYIPGSLSFPKGLNSAPGRPRVPPNSPVVFDVSLEYIPGLDLDLGE